MKKRVLSTRLNTESNLLKSNKNNSHQAMFTYMHLASNYIKIPLIHYFNTRYIIVW
jgi:hypothetical protein